MLKNKYDLTLCESCLHTASENAVLMETTIYLPSQDLQVHLNKLECRVKINLFNNSTQIVKLMY